MNPNAISPDGGDLPPNHPLVLEALKGIIAGPISELRTNVDSLITNPATGLKRSSIDYNNILPQKNTPQPNQAQFDQTSAIANSIVNQMIPTNYATSSNSLPFVPQVNIPQVVQHLPTTNAQPIDDPNQPELPLFKPTEISDVYKKLFDIELKLDIIIKHVKGSQNKK